MIWRKTVKAFAILHSYDNEVAQERKKVLFVKVLESTP